MAGRGIQWTVGQHDTGLALEEVLRHPPEAGTYVAGPIVDLTGATVGCVVERVADCVIVYDGACEVVDADAGHVRQHLTPDITAYPGRYTVHWTAVWPDGHRLDFPTDAGQPFSYLLVRSRTVGSTTPVQTTYPTTPVAGDEPVPDPLFIPDGQTGNVTGNGQHVFAGAGTTITTDPDVTLFTIAWWDTQSPWLSAADVPVGAWSTPSIEGKLVISAGDEVTVAADVAGVSWHGTMPAVGTAVAGTGSDDQIFERTAGVTISAMQVVSLSTADLVIPFDPTDPAGPGVFGIATSTSIAGGMVTVVTDGPVDGATGLIPGAHYWAGPAGTLTTVEPSSPANSGELLVYIGYAADADTLVVQVGDPIVLA